VKWYRTAGSSTMENFYSFELNRQPQARHYKLKGVKVDVSLSPFFPSLPRETSVTFSPGR